jgi:hypothetical protein
MVLYMIFRLSQKLAKKLAEGDLPSLSLDDNPYADWSAHLFMADRTEYVILTNTKSLYSVVMYGKGITDDGVFIDRALSSLREFMEADGQSFVYQRFVAPISGIVQFAKASDRSVTGSISELVTLAKLWLAEDRLSPHDVGVRLNGVLLSAIARKKSEKYGTPKEAFRSLVEKSETEAGGAGVADP